ncbi:MAG: carbohydrate ABC transporter permease [bacterium]
MENKEKMGIKRIKIFIAYFFLIIASFLAVFPFIWMVLLSLMGQNQIFSLPPSIIPNPFVFTNYINIFKNIPIAIYFFNSLIVAIFTCLGQVLFSAMAAYAFARLNFRFREPLFFIFLATIMIPPQVNIVPLFFLMKQFGWIDSYFALIIPGFFGGFGVFLLRQWFKGMPKDLEDAAKLDGCNYFDIFFKIAIPLAMPAIITLALFTFISSWNSFMWPLIVTNSENMRTLPVGLAVFKGSFRETTEWGQLMSCAVISTIPAIGLFLAGQKFFIKGIMAGGIKE